jgi:hypothetical protein
MYKHTNLIKRVMGSRFTEIIIYDMYGLQSCYWKGDDRDFDEQPFPKRDCPKTAVLNVLNVLLRKPRRIQRQGKMQCKLPAIERVQYPTAEDLKMSPEDYKETILRLAKRQHIRCVAKVNLYLLVRPS